MLSCKKISYIFTAQQRAKIKRKRWYFDVTGGGNLTPSLVNGNIYVYCFADSYSRKYFEYYTKKTDDKTTFKVLQKFDNDVLKFIRSEITDDEILFIQSDNGELNTDEVRAFIITGGIFQ